MRRNIEDLRLPATGRRVEFRGFDLGRIHDGRIVEIWHVEEMATMSADLGLAADPAEG